MKIVVIGGSGLVGRKLVAILRQQGREVLSASPSSGVNVLTGRGLLAALQSTHVVVDASHLRPLGDRAERASLETPTRNAVAAAIAADVRHYVLLTARDTRERLVLSAPLPYTVVRARRLLELIRRMAGNLRVSGLAHDVVLRVAADDIACALARAAAAEPRNGVDEITCPDPYWLDQMLRKLLRLDDPQLHGADATSART